MKFVHRYVKLLAVVPAAVLLAHCASDLDQRIEETQFLLDQGKYAEAEAKIRPAVVSNPTDTEANFLLATALLGQGILGNNATYLGLISSIEEDKAANKSEFSTFTRIAPATEAGISKIEEARDVLIPLSASLNVADPHFKDVYLQLYVARLFEIAGAVTRIGAITDTSTCHADALTAPQAERFQDNLNNVNSDGENAGLPTDFALIDRIDTIGSALTTAVNAQGGDLLMGIEAFFKASFPGQC